jgi:hypothetical protein
MKKFTAAVIICISAFIMAHTLASNYVGNANSKKFHYADCSMVDKMNPANKVFMNTREEAINAGYVPCKKCNP